MERDTIAQRLSALRKEVFMTPHSPVSDPSRPIGGSRLTQQPSVTQVNFLRFALLKTLRIYHLKRELWLPTPIFDVAECGVLLTNHV